MILYKFFDPSRVDVLVSRMVRFTQPCDFNDPFEALPCIAGPSREALRRKLKRDERVDSYLSRAADYFANNGPQMVLTEVSKTFGVLCLAEVSDDPLLWGHYAHGHRGFALGFDAEHPWFQTGRTPDPVIDAIRAVTYQVDRPVIRVMDHLEQAEFDPLELARLMLFTKHTSWSYEVEWRLIRLLSDADETRTRVGSMPICLFQFPMEALREVILGARASESTAATLKAQLAQPGWGHVTLRRARVSLTSYLLDIRTDGV